MGRLSKQVIAARKARQRGRELRARQAAASPDLEAPVPLVVFEVAYDEDNLDVVLSDFEDDNPVPAETAIASIGQPEQGWKAAERSLGYSHSNANKTPQSRYYYRQKQEAKEEEGRALNQKYGSITRFFQRNTTMAPVPDLEAEAEIEATALVSGRQKDLAALEEWKKNTKPIAEHANRVMAVINLMRIEIQNGYQWGRKTEHSMLVAATFSKGIWWSKCLRYWKKQWEEMRIPPPKPCLARTQNSRSLFGDEGIQLAVREYLNEAGPKVSPRGICTAVQNVLQSRRVTETMDIESALSTPVPSADHEPTTTIHTRISIRTAHRWLAKLGWIYSRNKKGYVDGHEREDVVKYRQEVFLPAITAILPTLREYDDDGERIKEVSANQQRRILVTHDESTFNANDGVSFSWKKAGTEWLKPKARGKGLIVSEFLTAASGRLSYINPSGERVLACEIIKYGSGKSDDGWWNSEKMVEQVKKKAIPIFEKRFPKDIALFAFDNSSGHACKAIDALVASRMNLNPGGKQPCMRNTEFSDGRIQYMVFQAGECDWETGHPIPEALIGKPKGMKRVLQERGLWRPNLRKQCGRTKKSKGKGTLEAQDDHEERVTDQCTSGKGDCCALRILEQQPDFLGEESLLERVIKDAGHEVIFYPKFHCELNYIEAYWAAVKRYTRENCSYSFTELEPTVREGLDSVSLTTIRRFANRSMWWIFSYMGDLTPEQKAYVQKVYASHRREFGNTNVAN